MNTKIKNIFWPVCLKYLQKNIPIKNFLKYINPIQTYMYQNKIYILAPNSYIKKKIEENYLNIIKNIIENIFEKKYELKVELGSLHIKKKYDYNARNSTHINDKYISLSAYKKIFIYTNDKSKIIKIIFNKLKPIKKNIKIINLLDISLLNNEIIHELDYLIITDIHEINYDLKIKLKNLTTLLINENKKIIFISNKLKDLQKSMNEIIHDALILNYFKHKNKIKYILEVVLNKYSIALNDIFSKNRRKKIILIRQIIFYLCKKLTTYSLSEIIKLFSNYNKATIIYSYKKIKNLIKNDTALAEQLEWLEKKIKNGNNN